jgi:hypothetical protein
MPQVLQVVEAIIGFLDRHALGVQALAALITLLLTAILAWATWRYAGHTKRALRLSQGQLSLGQQQLAAAIEQSEALQKPSITIKAAPRHAEELIVERRAAAVAQTPTVVLLNLGSGPALNVSYQFDEVNPSDKAHALKHPESVPYVEPRQEWATRLSLSSLSNRTLEFRANYESLSGTEYETRMRIESGVIVSSSFGRSSAPEK